MGRRFESSLVAQLVEQWTTQPGKTGIHLKKTQRGGPAAKAKGFCYSQLLPGLGGYRVYHDTGKQYPTVQHIVRRLLLPIFLLPA